MLEELKQAIKQTKMTGKRSALVKRQGYSRITEAELADAWRKF
jgi:hypothetical protein